MNRILVSCLIAVGAAVPAFAHDYRPEDPQASAYERTAERDLAGLETFYANRSRETKIASVPQAQQSGFVCPDGLKDKDNNQKDERSRHL